MKETDLKPTRDLNLVTRDSTSTILGGEKVMIGLETNLLEMKHRLTGTTSKLEVISIVGLGGIGKTTLARTIYDDKLIAHHFHVRAWITVSQTYNIKYLLLGLLKSMNEFTHEESTDGLKEHLYKALKGNKYLIVLDDVWSTDMWDELRRFFPNDDNGSRVLLTTRVQQVGEYAANSSSPLHHMSLLGNEESWHLLCRLVFSQDPCPLELEGIGRVISEKCRGLPLAISVIGGLLSTNRSREFWSHVAQNVISLINRDEDQCSKILWLSYSHLPHPLKACFLYKGVFPEDYEIHVTELIRLWVAEGFLKPYRSRTLEETAQEYLKDIIDRNLVFVAGHGSSGKPKYCRVHDLLRDLILKEAQKEKFLGNLSNSAEDNLQHFTNQRRVSIFQSDPEHIPSYVYSTLDSMASIRSLVCNIDFPETIIDSLRKLRVLSIRFCRMSSTLPAQLRYLSITEYLPSRGFAQLPRAIPVPKNIQTIKVIKFHGGCYGNRLPFEIWNLSRLRHLDCRGCELPDCPRTLIDEEDCSVLQDLQTLHIKDFKCTDEICRRIPNVKKLKTCYSNRSFHHYFLHNLVHLHKLETFSCRSEVVMDNTFWSNIALPCQLKKLTLENGRSSWAHLTVVGSVPCLEVLKLEHNAFQGSEWEPIEVDFCSLKFLKIVGSNLAHFRAESIHFPRLQHLILRNCDKLEEIPSGIGEIPTLQMIQLWDCSPSAENSARQILDEQRDYGNDDLQVHIRSVYDTRV